MPDVTLQTAHGPLPMATATPITPAPWPGVVVIHDILGMSDDLMRQCDWLASEGFLAAAPDLFSFGSKMRCVRSIISDVRSGKGRSFDEIQAARVWLTQQPGCNGKIGVIGFCLGGGFALMLAPNHGFSASSPNYGRFPPDPESALAGACPIVASYGAKDRMLRGSADRLEKILTALGVPHDVKEYPDAGHSFLNDHRTIMSRVVKVLIGTGYHAPSALDARKRIVAFFRKHLAA